MTSGAVNGTKKKTKKPKNKITNPPARRPAETSQLRAEIAVALIRARKTAGLSQVEVSERLSRPKSWIGKLETSRRSLLFSEALELAELYEANVEDLSPRRPSRVGQENERERE